MTKFNRQNHSVYVCDQTKKKKTKYLIKSTCTHSFWQIKNTLVWGIVFVLFCWDSTTLSLWSVSIYMSLYNSHSLYTHTHTHYFIIHFCTYLLAFPSFYISLHTPNQTAAISFTIVFVIDVVVVALFVITYRSLLKCDECTKLPSRMQ